MTPKLDIHVASPQELAAAHRNVFDIWSKGLPLEEHVQTRLESPKHGLATWYVGTMDGQVVVSLGCYPLVFAYRGQLVLGFSIGSVYTVKEYRGQGLAPQLIAFAEAEKLRSGAKIGLLYCDINPDYYARLGYELCPSLEGWLELDGAAVAQPPAYHLLEISAAERWPELARLYEGYHGAMPISIARNETYWQAILQRYTDDRFFALADKNGHWHAYVRIGVSGKDWRITDFALADQSLDLAESLYAAAIKLARSAGAERFGGWLPDHPSARQFFDLTPRRTEITMLKSFVPSVVLDEEAIELTSRFCEIDHV